MSEDRLKRGLLSIGNQKQRSVSRRLTVGLIATIGVVSSVSLFLSSIWASRRAKTELEHKAIEYIGSLTDILELPIWNLDEEYAQSIGRSYLHNEFIAGLKIIDSSGTVYIEMEKKGDAPIISKSSEVFHKGESLGHVEISLTSSYYEVINRLQFWSNSIIIIINLLSLIIMTGFFLRLFLRNPIHDLGKIVKLYESGKYDSAGHDIAYLEFQPMVDVLSEMGDTIKTQMQELRNAEKKYRSIFENAAEGIFQCTPEGRFISVNPSMAKILGYDTPQEVFAAYNDIQNPEVLANSQAKTTYL